MTQALISSLETELILCYYVVELSLMASLLCNFEWELKNPILLRSTETNLSRSGFLQSFQGLMHVEFL